MTFNHTRVRAAYETARDLLLAERIDGHWVGELSASALSTATAVSSLALVSRAQQSTDSTKLERLIDCGAAYLLEHQNDDGGWGDTDKSYSNIATTYLAMAALHLSGHASDSADQLQRAQQYIEASGSIPGLKRRYGVDKTFVVPILTNCALAGLVPWKEVAPLPFELACVPQRWYRFVGMPVVSYAIPALVAIGQARYFHAPPRNPVTRAIRAVSVSRSLKVLRQMQPASGGYLEAVPLTSFVVMSLAATGRAEHQVTREGVKFLIDSVRPDGSWPIDTNLATWVTSLALNALAGAGEDITQYASLEWLLSCQHLERHPFTGADPGGWGWSDLSGAVPDADDTPGAMLALMNWIHSDPRCSESAVIQDSWFLGCDWLLKIQNRDGGWPTFCRGWGRLPFDRSGVDITAHAIRAICQRQWDPNLLQSWMNQGIERAVIRGFKFIERHQRPDGSWIPLWFGNQDQPDEENPIYGTAKVLLAYRDTGRTESPAAQRGFEYLLRVQNADGGWGGGASVGKAGRRIGEQLITSTVEETALAVEALLAAPKDYGSAGASPSQRDAASQRDATLERGLAWLCHATENDRLLEPAPIGFYFAKLWYYERLYPLIFTVAALGRARRELKF